MKVILQIDSLLDDLYADSALSDLSALSPVLTPDSRPALQRFIVNAAAGIVGALSPALCAFEFPDPDSDGGTMTFDFDNDIPLNAEGLAVYLSAVIVRATLRHLAISRGDNPRATLYDHCLSVALNHLRSLILAPSLPPPITPSYW